MTLPLRRLGALLLVGFGLALASLAVHADPPYRVARLSYESGNVSFSPAGAADWSRAAINRPLGTGDRLWVDAGSRAELQLDGGALRVGDQTNLSLLNIDDRIAQLQLTQGALEIRVWRLDPGQSVEIDTPNLAAVIRRPGTYRIDVDEKYSSTRVTTRAGETTLYGEGNAFRIAAGETWEFFDTALRDYDSYRPEPTDDLARFASARDRRWEASVSARHVSRELIGFEELDEYGAWRQVPEYGWVWFPQRVSAGWAPYRDGHWAWVEPWGWTWIDDAPWGFAPSHYGRWAFVDSRWCWVPGPVNARPVYAPALVAFVGGGLSASISGGVIGWFPLGPRDVYRPAYGVSRDYFTRVNMSNTTVNITQITNVYEKRNIASITYANQRVPGAVVAVPTAAFTQAKPVAREVVRVQAQNIAAQAVMTAPPVAPAKQSALGAQPAARKPPEHAFTKQVVAQTPPPAPPASAPAHAAAPAPAVKVLSPTQPAAAPPPAPSVNRPERERRGGPLQRAPAAAAPPAAPAPTAPAAPTPPLTAPAAAAQPAAPAAEQRGRSEERARGEERQRERPPLAPVRPNAAPPQVAPPAPMPAARPPEAAPVPPQRREERREQREAVPPAAAPAPAPQRPQPTAPPPQAAPAPRPPEATAPAPQQRREERRDQRAEQRREAASEQRRQ